MRILPWIGTATILAAGVLTFAQAGSAAEAEAGPSSVVEGYSYPAGDAVEGIKLIKGDGNILLVDCVDGGVGQLRVHSFVRDDDFCFEFRGKQGYLALVLERAYEMRDLDADHSVEAKVTEDGVEQIPVIVPDNRWATFKPATLLELRSNA